MSEDDLEPWERDELALHAAQQAQAQQRAANDQRRAQALQGDPQAAARVRRHWRAAVGR